MTGRERILATLAGLPTDRIAVLEAFWPKVESSFRRSAGILNGTSLIDHFDLDGGQYFFDQSLGYETKILEEHEDYQIVENEWQERVKLFTDGSATPGHLSQPVRSRDDWHRYRQRLRFSPARMEVTIQGKSMPEYGTVQMYQSLKRNDRCRILSLLGPFECDHHLIGFEQQQLLMYDDPELLTETYRTHTDLILEGLEHLCTTGLSPDVLWLYEDVAYGNGLMFSLDVYRRLLKPFHARIIEAAGRYGIPLIYHTDGNPTSIIPDLIEIGVSAIHPLEVKAGCDVRQLIDLYSDSLTFIGNIDARNFVAEREEKLFEEIDQKLPAACERGRYIFHSDHSLPDGSSYDVYRRVLEYVRSPERGWNT